MDPCFGGHQDPPLPLVWLQLVQTYLKKANIDLKKGNRCGCQGTPYPVPEMLGDLGRGPSGGALGGNKNEPLLEVGLAIGGQVGTKRSSKQLQQFGVFFFNVRLEIVVDIENTTVLQKIHTWYMHLHFLVYTIWHIWANMFVFFCDLTYKLEQVFCKNNKKETTP